MKGFNHIHLNDQMDCERWESMMDEASKEGQRGVVEEEGAWT